MLRPWAMEAGERAGREGVATWNVAVMHLSEEDFVSRCIVNRYVMFTTGGSCSRGISLRDSRTGVHCAFALHACPEPKDEI